VRSYLRAAMRKLGVGNRTAAVHAARQRGAL
jgi:LuxR family transcriptional regulator, regulator of acetate metabolism